MKHFLDELDTQLVSAANRRAAAEPAATLRHRRRLKTGTAVVAASAAAIGIALASGGAADRAQAIDLPIMQRQASNAISVRTAVPVERRAEMNFTEARAFASRYGRGYVVPSRDQNSICLVVPDVDASGYGVSCATVEKVKAAGLVTTLTSVQGMKNPSQFVAILPAGATKPAVTFSEGRREPLRPDDGVLVVQATTDVSVSWRLPDGTRKSTDVEAFERERDTSVWCGESVGLAIIPTDQAYHRRTLCAPLRRADERRKAEGTRLPEGILAVDCGGGDIRTQRSTEVTGSVCKREREAG